METNNILILNMFKSTPTRSFRSLLYTLLLILLLGSCKSTEKSVDYKDLSYLYNPTKNQINPRFVVNNQTDESSVLSVRFSVSDLFFSEANPQGEPKAMDMLTVKL